MAAADGDAANGQARKNPTKAQMAPGEGLPANLYNQVKLAIYQSHGKSIIAATMQAKLDECHGPFQLQKFLIRWGGQFSKLAMFGVRLEMMATARSAADLTEQDPPDNFGKDFKQAVIKHAAIAKATREEHAARARQLQEQWAATMAELDKQEAALDEVRAKQIANRRTRRRTTAKSLGSSVNEPQEKPDSRPGSRPRSRSEKRAKPTTPKVKKTGKVEARVRLSKELLDADPYRRKYPAGPMSPERQQIRSKPLFEPRAAPERAPSPERLGFHARPMPPRPNGASHGLPTWMKVALTQRMEDRVGVAVHPPASCKGDVASFDEFTDHPQPAGGDPQTDDANVSTKSDLVQAIADHICAANMARASTPGDVPTEPRLAAVDYCQLDQQLQQHHRQHHQSPRRPPRQEQASSASVQPTMLSPRVTSYGLRPPSPPQTSHPRRPQTARASMGRATSRQAVRSQYSGSPSSNHTRPQTAQMARTRPRSAGAARVTPATAGVARTRPATAGSATRWVDIEQHRPSLMVS